MKIYECTICKRFTSKGVKNSEEFRGTRKDVRKHLREVHGVKTILNPLKTRDEDKASAISKETTAEEWR